MINLAGTNWVLRVVTASASNVEASASWVDIGGSPAVVTPGAQNTAAITTATTTTFVPAPASGQTRNVKGAVIANTSVGASTLVTVQVYDGSVACQLARALLAPGDRLALGEDGLWTHQQAIASRSIPVGSIASMSRASAPAGWLKCDGLAVSRASYADLFAVIGTTYGAGDGSTTFAVPDLRGEFLRGLDDGRGVDTGRVLGSAQGDLVKSHSHDIGVDGSVGSTKVNPGSTWGFGPNGTPGQGHSTYSAGGAENRPRNIALPFFIAH